MKKEDLWFITPMVLSVVTILTLIVLLFHGVNTNTALASGPLDMQCTPSEYAIHRCENEEAVCYFRRDGISCMPKHELMRYK